MPAAMAAAIEIPEEIAALAKQETAMHKLELPVASDDKDSDRINSDENSLQQSESQGTNLFL